MIKVGHLVPVAVVKSLPDYNSYLTMIVGTELFALLPKKFANRLYRVGDNTLASIFFMDGVRIVLTQRSAQYFRKLVETLLSPLLQERLVEVRRAATVPGARFAKVAVKSLNGEDPVGQSIPYLIGAKQYTDDTITLVRYSEEIREYVKNALIPAPRESIKKVIYFQTLNEALVFVEPTLVGLFLGKGCANAATASKLVGVRIKIDCPAW